MLGVLFHSCLENCNLKAKTFRRTVIKVECHRIPCQPEILRYDWSLYVLRHRDNKHSWEKIENLEERTSGDINSPNIVFPGKAVLPGNNGDKHFEDGVKYKVTADIYVKEGVIKEELTFVTNSPPVLANETGGCFVTPTVGYTLDTEFSFRCRGWLDEDQPLNYELRYRTNTSIVVIHSGSEPSAKVRLPLGNPQHNYSFTLEMLIKDSLGSATLQEVSVKVKFTAFWCSF